MGKKQSSQDSSNMEMLAFLHATDWYVIREMDSGKPIPPEIKKAREAARQSIVGNGKPSIPDIDEGSK